MTLISTLVNKFMILIGLSDEELLKSNSIDLFAVLALIMFVIGIMTIVRNRPVTNSYNKYTTESLLKAAKLIGLSNIVLGVFDIVVGVIKMEWVNWIVLTVLAVVILVIYGVLVAKVEKIVVKKDGTK